MLTLWTFLKTLFFIGFVLDYITFLGVHKEWSTISHEQLDLTAY